jgi:Adenylate kinase and related kinases
VNLILLGLPGAGKGTQAKKISQEYNLPHIATGDILRLIAEEETPLGVRIKEYLDKGQLVPDEDAIMILKEELKKLISVKVLFWMVFPGQYIRPKF